MENFDGVMVEKLKNSEWYYLYRNMEELVPGDIFRMWHLIDDRWVLYKDSLGHTKWCATSDPYLEDDLWHVKCKRLTHK